MNQQETIISEINQLDPTVLSEAGWVDPQGYLNRVYGFISKMVLGKVYLVAELATTETTLLFVAVVKLYICEVGGVSFLRDDYKEISKDDSS